MADNITQPTSLADHLKKGLTVAELKAYFDGGKRMKWNESFNPSFGYDPVPVFVDQLTATTIRFSLINCDHFETPTADETFTIELEDFDRVHHKTPSTQREELETDPNTDRRIVILMLHPNKMPDSSKQRSYKTVAAEKSSTISERGKWPMTTSAAVTPPFQRLINKITEIVESNQALTPDLLRQLRIAEGFPPFGPMPPSPLPVPP